MAFVPYANPFKSQYTLNLKYKINSCIFIQSKTVQNPFPRTAPHTVAVAVAILRSQRWINQNCGDGGLLNQQETFLLFA